MAETCWICNTEFEKGKGQADSDLMIDLIHAPNATPPGDGTATEGRADYQKTSVRVPRCPACSKKVSTWGWRGACLGALAGAVIGDLLLSVDSAASGITAYAFLLGGAVAGFIAGYLAGMAIRKNVQQRRASSFPAVKALQDGGWSVGHNP
jgi:hypothetical protein